MADRFSQGLVPLVGMRLQPAVSLDPLLGKRGGRLNLRHKRIGVQCDRRNQLLQLLRRLPGIGWRLRTLCRALLVLIGWQVLR